ncbi:MAG: glycosyltransferase family 2 protein [Planctomycetota bacterium]|nr:MAG: glycosyltransferase family 2 protein [Planctomycetota bacterium]
MLSATVEHIPKGFTGTPLVSVIIPNYEGEKCLPACLESLAKQTFRDFEVLIVDNGSKDAGTPGALALVRRLAPGQPFPLRYFDLGKNYGFATAVNRGIERSRGCFIALLNNDTECDPGWLLALADAMEAHPETGFLASKLLLASSRGHYDCTGHCLTTAGVGEVHNRFKPVDKNEKGRPVFGACAAASMYRREALEAVGLLDESYFMYYEDLDLDMRLRMAGYSCRYVPEAIVYHSLGAAARGLAGALKTFLVSRNMESFFFTYFPGPFRLRHFINHIGLVILQTLEYSLRGAGGPYIRGKLAFLRDFRKTRDRRREILKRFGNGNKLSMHFAGPWFFRYLSAIAAQLKYKNACRGKACLAPTSNKQREKNK